MQWSVQQFTRACIIPYLSPSCFQNKPISPSSATERLLKIVPVLWHLQLVSLHSRTVLGRCILARRFRRGRKVSRKVCLTAALFHKSHPSANANSRRYNLQLFHCSFEFDELVVHLNLAQRPIYSEHVFTKRSTKMSSWQCPPETDWSSHSSASGSSPVARTHLSFAIRSAISFCERTRLCFGQHFVRQIQVLLNCLAKMFDLGIKKSNIGSQEAAIQIFNLQ